MVRPRVGFTTPYPMQTMRSRKKENELRAAFRMATTISSTLEPMFDPFLLR